MSLREERERDVLQTARSMRELRDVVETRTVPIGFLRGLLSLFLVARLGFAFVTVMFPEGGVLTDSLGYLALARRFAEDGQYGVQASGEADMLRPPGYPVLLAGIEKALGPDLYWVTLVQLLFSGLTSLVLLRLGIELQRPRAGLIAAWLYALSPNVLLWSLTIMSEVSFALMLALTTLLIVRMVNSFKRWWPLVAGFGLAVMAYVRPIALSLVPIWAGVVYWYRRERWGKRRALGSALALALIVVAAVVPWAYRNWETYDEFVFSTVTKKTWVGFNLAEVVAQAEGIDRNQAVPMLNAERGVLELTLDIAARYPVTFISAQLLGIIRTLAGSDIGTWGIVLGDGSWTGLGLLSGVFWGTLDEALDALILGRGTTPIYGLLIHGVSLAFSVSLLIPAAFGAFLIRLDSDAGRLFRLLAIASLFVLLVLPGAAGQARFRVPAEPYLAMLAGLGVGYVVDSLALWSRRRRNRRRLQTRRE